VLLPIFTNESPISKICLMYSHLLLVFLLCDYATFTSALDRESEGEKPCFFFADSIIRQSSGFRGLNDLHGLDGLQGPEGLCVYCCSPVGGTLLQLEFVVRLWCDISGTFAKTVWIGATSERRLGHFERCRSLHYLADNLFTRRGFGGSDVVFCVHYITGIWCRLKVSFGDCRISFWGTE
jgi:hypothetical protein